MSEIVKGPCAIVPLTVAEVAASDLCVMVEWGGYEPNTNYAMNSRAAKPTTGPGHVLLLPDDGTRVVVTVEEWEGMLYDAFEAGWFDNHGSIADAWAERSPEILGTNGGEHHD